MVLVRSTFSKNTITRYDASAGNITESSIWTTIGHTPWAKPSAAWYHMLGDFPFQAIRQAAVLNEYTLTDYGTWCAIESETRDKLTVFVCRISLLPATSKSTLNLEVNG